MVLNGQWKFKDEHITLKEGRCLTLAVRRMSRSPEHRGKTHLIFVDNLARAFSLGKGRSCNHGMLRLNQKIGALLLACNSVLRVRWIPSECKFRTVCFCAAGRTGAFSFRGQEPAAHEILNFTYGKGRCWIQSWLRREARVGQAINGRKILLMCLEERLNKQRSTPLWRSWRNAGQASDFIKALEAIQRIEEWRARSQALPEERGTEPHQTWPARKNGSTSRRPQAHEANRFSPFLRMDRGHPEPIVPIHFLKAADDSTKGISSGAT